MGISTLSDEVDKALRDLALSDDLEKLVDIEGASVWENPWADWALTMAQNLRSRACPAFEQGYSS